VSNEGGVDRRHRGEVSQGQRRPNSGGGWRGGALDIGGSIDATANSKYVVRAHRSEVYDSRTSAERNVLQLKSGRDQTTTSQSDGPKDGLDQSQTSKTEGQKEEEKSVTGWTTRQREQGKE